MFTTSRYDLSSGLPIEINEITGEIYFTSTTSNVLDFESQKEHRITVSSILTLATQNLEQLMS